jgi:hypothetical protein
MRVTIWLLGIWFVSLVFEIPYAIFVTGFQGGLSAAVGPVVIEAIFVALMVVFIVFGRRAKMWSYIGAGVIGILHAILSAAIYFGARGPPLALAVWLTLLPAAVAIAGAASVLELRRQPA